MILKHTHYIHMLVYQLLASAILRVGIIPCQINTKKSWPSLALYPGHMEGGKSGLISIVCACVNDSRNLQRTSLIMDKLHVVVMWRNNQTRYRACSVAAVFMQRWLPLSETQGVTRQGLRYNHRQFHHHCACSWKQMAESRSRWTYQILWVATGIRLYHRRYIWSHPAALLSMWNLPFQYNKERTWALYQSPRFYLPCSRDKLETDVLRSYTPVYGKGIRYTIKSWGFSRMRK